MIGYIQLSTLFQSKPPKDIGDIFMPYLWGLGATIRHLTYPTLFDPTIIVVSDSMAREEAWKELWPVRGTNSIFFCYPKLLRTRTYSPDHIRIVLNAPAIVELGKKSYGEPKFKLDFGDPWQYVVVEEICRRACGFSAFTNQHEEWIVCCESHGNESRPLLLFRSEGAPPECRDIPLNVSLGENDRIVPIINYTPTDPRYMAVDQVIKVLSPYVHQIPEL